MALFGKRNPGAITVDTSIFAKMVKQHEDRAAYLKSMISHVESEVDRVHKHYDERADKLDEERIKTVNALLDQKTAIASEHAEVSQRAEALKTLTSNL